MSQAPPYFQPSFAEPTGTPYALRTRARALTPPQWGYVLGVSLAGGLLGVLGALIQETRGGISFLGPVVLAPMVEEALKPSGIYYLQAWRPELLRNQTFTAILCGISGLTFGYLEGLVYLYIYHPDHSTQFVVLRLGLTPAMHALFSFIVGLGINRQLVEGAYGRAPFPGSSQKFYLTAMLLHGSYNLIVTILAVTGAWQVR